MNKKILDIGSVSVLIIIPLFGMPHRNLSLPLDQTLLVGHTQILLNRDYAGLRLYWKVSLPSAHRLLLTNCAREQRECSYDSQSSFTQTEQNSS